MIPPVARGRILLSLALLPLLGACTERPSAEVGPIGTPRLREALFDTILARTARREAFSEIKNRTLDFDPLEEMERLRNAVVRAESEDDLFHALVALSNARRDRHLSVGLLSGGLRPSFTDGLESWDGDDPPEPRAAPILVHPDYGESSAGYFVAEVALGAAREGGASVGDRIVSVDGVPVRDFEDAARPYIRHSTRAGFRWKLAEALPRRTALFPPGFLRDSLTLTLRGAEGPERTVSLPYVDADQLSWTGLSRPRYPGFSLRWSTPTFDLHLPDDGRRLVVLQWHRFESSSLVADVDRLVERARAGGFLDHAVIFDATRSGGGSLGAYAVQRLQSRPFRTTFGNLRISDVIQPFIDQKEAEFREGRVFDSGSPETVDDGTWLMEWIRTDLAESLARGDAYTAAVPFKNAHAPRDSDGVLEPAPVHFLGPLVVFSGPNGGSHLDQFMSIVVDNDLGYVVGMPAGGYSNTWEWEEALTYPGTPQPVVGFMWSIGHTIRPNGEVLEGNPARVHERIPLTAENGTRYYELLFEAAERYLDGLGFEVRR
ncbi:MAG: hypothetical protein PVI57_04575 [Gemmatimonadota bacterium]|jgi:hypothetical protein